MGGPRVLIDRYQLIRQLGAGAQGTVWLARDEKLRREVAVKQVSHTDQRFGEAAEIARQRAMREGRIAARLNHPNAVSVYDVALHDGDPWLVMEYVPSQTLTEVVRGQGGITPRQAAALGAQIAGALAEAHRLEIVHRDVKPSNILLMSDGRAKITDFGIARGMDDATLTATGLVTGTPAYFAPELARGVTGPTPATDVWSLGATLYYAVEGTPPFGSDENPLVLLGRIASQEVQRPVHAGELEHVLLRMLSRDPAMRPTMRQTRAMLSTIAGEYSNVPVLIAEPNTEENDAIQDVPDATKVVEQPPPADSTTPEVAPDAAQVGAATPAAAGVADSDAEVPDLGEPEAEPAAESDGSGVAAADPAGIEAAGATEPDPAEPEAEPVAEAGAADADADEVAADDVAAEADDDLAGVGAAAAPDDSAGAAGADLAASAHGTADPGESDDDSEPGEFAAASGEAAHWAEPASSGASTARYGGSSDQPWSSESARARDEWLYGSSDARRPEPPAAAQASETPAETPAELAERYEPLADTAAPPPPPGGLDQITGRYDDQPFPARQDRQRKRGIVLIAAAAFMLAVAGLGSYLLLRDHDKDLTASPPEQTTQGAAKEPKTTPKASHPQDTPKPTEKPSPSNTPKPTTPPPTTPAGSPMRANAMTALVADYYGLLPNQQQQAWAWLGPKLKAQGFASYTKWWSSVRTVSVSNLKANPSGKTVTGTVRFVMNSGRTATERHTFGLVETADKKGLLINTDN